MEGAATRFQNVYDQWDGEAVEQLAQGILDAENINLKAQRHPLQGVNGQCRMRIGSDIMDVLTFELDSNDIRTMDYQVKKAFHELFHAKSKGLKHDIGNISFKEWAYMDDVFAESTAHHILKTLGINKEIAPSYTGHLIETLPKLKKLPEFRDCKTIADFVEVAMKYRYSDNPSAEWSTLLNLTKNIDHNVIEYSEDYLEYIAENKEGFVDKLLENMPRYTSYKSNMVNDIDMAIKSINANVALRDNEEMIFQNALITTMNRLGVK